MNDIIQNHSSIGESPLSIALSRGKRPLNQYESENKPSYVH